MGSDTRQLASQSHDLSFLSPSPSSEALLPSQGVNILSGSSYQNPVSKKDLEIKQETRHLELE